MTESIFERKRRDIVHELRQIGLEKQESLAEAKLILEHVSGLKHAEQIVSDLKELKADWLREISCIINLRRDRKPLAYCLGEIEFAGLKLRIIPGVLIPRVDTETLVEAVVNWAKNKGSLAIAEIGVGCGAIAIALLKRLPEVKVWGCDITEAAVITTLGNARKHGVDDRLTLVHGDWKKNLPRDLNVVVSNPPYLPLALSAKRSNKTALQPEVYFEPQEALFNGSEDGLDFYRQFVQVLPEHFINDDSANCFAAFEIGDGQKKEVLKIFEQAKWQNLRIEHDVNGLARVLMASPFSK